jgi:hypothetical protein
LRVSEPNVAVQQYLNSAGVAKTGQEIIDQQAVSWSETDFISMDSIVAALDINSMRYLRKVCLLFLLCFLLPVCVPYPFP